jgi:hypothetical protein
MSLFENWQDLASNQNKDTFKAFWEKYSATEVKIYNSILDDPKKIHEGKFSELQAYWDVDPVFFMGFLDGVSTSIADTLDLDSITEESDIRLEIDLETLYFNMHSAKAQHLYGLPQWESLLTEEQRQEIIKKQRKSGVAVREDTPGRNDPCSCGSGKKYKKCCGAVI